MTSSPHGTVERTADGGLIRFERDLPFPVEEVWAALTTPERLADWWPPMAGDVTVDLRVGGAIVFDWPGTEMPRLEFTITQLEPPTLLEHTHTSPGSWARWELEAVDEGTHLRSLYFVPDIDMALERGDAVGLHYSLDRLAPALAGHPVPWDMDAFLALRDSYGDASPSAG